MDRRKKEYQRSWKPGRGKRLEEGGRESSTRETQPEEGSQPKRRDAHRGVGSYRRPRAGRRGMRSTSQSDPSGGGAKGARRAFGLHGDTFVVLRTQGGGAPGESGCHERRLSVASRHHAASWKVAAPKAASTGVETWLMHSAHARFYHRQTLHATNTNGARIEGQGGARQQQKQQTQRNNADEPPPPPSPREGVSPPRSSTRHNEARTTGRSHQGGGGGGGGEQTAIKKDKGGGESTQAHSTQNRAEGRTGRAGECGAGMNRGARGRRSTQGLTAAAGLVGLSVSARPARGRPRRQIKRRRRGRQQHGARPRACFYLPNRRRRARRPWGARPLQPTGGRFRQPNRKAARGGPPWIKSAVEEKGAELVARQLGGRERDAAKAGRGVGGTDAEGRGGPERQRPFWPRRGGGGGTQPALGR